MANHLRIDKKVKTTIRQIYVHIITLTQRLKKDNQWLFCGETKLARGGKQKYIYNSFNYTKIVNRKKAILSVSHDGLVFIY